MAIPKAIRRRAPGQLRDHRTVRAVALAVGLIPPRTMHTQAEAHLLWRLAKGARCVVEIGVYEGSSAFVLCDSLTAHSELHLIDPFCDESGWAMRPGWRGTALATQVAVWRRARGVGPNVCWHVRRSQELGAEWAGPEIDLVFIDGDHSPEGCSEDWRLWHQYVRPGGFVAFHDARLGRLHGGGSPGPSAVVDDLLRHPGPPTGWRVAEELDSMVVVQRAG